MQKLLLLDLEETVIPVWSDWWAITGQCEKIKAFNETFQADKLGVFSWALWNETDQVEFNENKDVIEDAIDLPFDHDWTVEYFMQEILTKEQQGMGTKEFIQLFSKERALFALVLGGWMPNHHIVLFDDAVKACTFEVNGSKVEIINIDLVF